MENSDRELYSRIREGDRRAFAELYDRTEPALYRFALQFSGSRTVAEEAVHEAFLELIQPAGRFDASRGSLEGYLYGIVRNRCRVEWRRQAAESSAEPCAEDDVLRRLIGDEMTAALYVAVRRLPAAYREAVVLCDLEELSYEDAAKSMGCRVGTVRSRLHRARRLLAARLQPYRVASRAPR
jgi:RNA polymerase sigma-70 factor (ECF subfamily)